MPSKSQPSPPEEPTNIVALPPAAEAREETRFSKPENFINRELSWLEFNRRVLEEAQDPTQPLIERVKFLTIFSSNLDEFFEIRVAGIKQQIESETSDVGPDGLTPTDTFNAIQRTVHEMVATQYALWRDELTPCSGQERYPRARCRAAQCETGRLGAPLFPGRSFSDAYAAGGGRESSLSAALEQEPQSARARSRGERRRTAPRDRAGAAGSAALDFDAARQRARTNRGITFTSRP